MDLASTTCTGSCLIYVPLAIMPSILWLMFFVAQKKHKEKTKNLLSVALWGVIVALPVVAVERLTFDLFFAPIAASIAASEFIYTFFTISAIEEFAKFFVVRFKAMPRKFFDEPQDAVIYMITVALGFAAIENMAYVLNFATSSAELLQITAFRGITATFLHVVASGALGYFLALSLSIPHERKKFLYTGIAFAILLHSIYNYFIIKLETQAGFQVLILSSLLIISGVVVMVGLKKLANKYF